MNNVRNLGRKGELKILAIARNFIDGLNAEIRSQSKNLIFIRYQLVLCLSLEKMKSMLEILNRLDNPIHQSLDNVPFTEAKFKRKMQLKSLNSLTKVIKIPGKKALHFDPTILFVRLAAVAQREEIVEDYLDFELTSYPLSLFKNGMMRKPDKATLRCFLKKIKLILAI